MIKSRQYDIKRCQAHVYDDLDIHRNTYLVAICYSVYRDSKLLLWVSSLFLSLLSALAFLLCIRLFALRYGKDDRVPFSYYMSSY